LRSLVKQLFRFRDWAVHPPANFSAPIRHEILGTGVEWRFVAFRAQAALGSVVTFVAEWRNAYGSGHGKPRFPPGLRPRHARLAADAAETAIRFIATTMDDLALLAPKP
jgi:hypothetical protein